MFKYRFAYILGAAFEERYIKESLPLFFIMFEHARYYRH